MLFPSTPLPPTKHLIDHDVDDVTDIREVTLADTLDDVDDVDNEDEEDLRCGYRSWRPECLQTCNTSRFLLASVCWFAFVQGK